LNYTKTLFACSLVLAAGAGLGADPASLAAPARPRGNPEVSCLIQPSLEINVGTPVDGVLETVSVDRGDIVAPGQLLAKLNSGVEAAAVETQAAKADFGTRKRQRNEELQRKQLISTQELDELSTDQQMAELELRERRERLKLRAIHSPIRGVIVDVYRQRGDLVKQEKIFRIAQLDPLYVETILPSRMFGKLRPGQTFDVTPELGTASHKARVGQVDRVIDAASGTFRVRLLLPNSRYDLPSGQRCAINFQL
jgi:membrane fusion protein, multidrug efflux system